MALALRAGWSSSSSHPLIAALQSGLQTLFQSPSSLAELLPPILLAVPKSKTSHSRKRMRAANKHLQEKKNIVTCPGCGRAKASHNFCPHCYSIITRTFKAKIKENSLSKLESEKKAQSQLEDNNLDSKSLAEEDWAKERWGGKALEFGQPLTKWMRTRLGYTKSAPPVYFGKENTVTPSKPRDERGRVIGNKQPQEKKGDDDHDDHDDHHHHGGGGGMPSNLQFA